MSKHRPHDSTKSRVAPVFDELLSRDGSGEKWLASLLALPQHGRPLDRAASAELGGIEEARWDSANRKHREKKLAPPVSLLSWLARHLGEAHPGEITGKDDKAKRRRRLRDGDPATVGKALAKLRFDPESRGWWVLEGRSSPDVWLGTPRAVVVIEGKRTESGPTTKTSFLTGRHQMLRHMDVAYEIAGTRALLGFFIVEGDGAGDIPEVWRESAKQTLSSEALRGNLPHRPEAGRDAIAAGFLGVTTWQLVCERLGIEAGVLIDRI